MSNRLGTGPMSRDWRRPSENPPLEEVFRSIRVPATGSKLKRMMAFLGPGYLVAVGYMDPGNWATSLAGGSKFGYALLFIALLSNIMAIILQALCIRLGVASGRDLSQACRDAYPRPVVWGLWLLAELAICATDLAEVIGTAIGLNLLFGLPLEIGVIITALDVFLILGLQNLGFRWIEAFVVALLMVIAVCFAVQIVLANPDWGPLMRGFMPTTDIVTQSRHAVPGARHHRRDRDAAQSLPALGHRADARLRRHSPTRSATALKYATIDSTVALMFALLINASILILAAATFHKTGRTDIAELGDAHALLMPLLGASIAPTLFGIALLALRPELDGDGDAGRARR